MCRACGPTPRTRQRRPAGGARRQGSAGRGGPTDGMADTRVVDASGYVSFAGTNYRVGNAWRRRSAQVCVVADSAQLNIDGQIVRVHPIRHDRVKEYGAFATPNGRPRPRQDAPAGTGVKAAPIDERLPLRRAGAAGLRMTLGSRAAVGGEGVSQGLFDRCGMRAEGVGDLAAVDDEGFLELVLHLR